MITRTLPRKLTELGRLRIGDREPNAKGGGTHPHKLGAFRLTSPNGSLLHFAAEAYGGEVHPWTGEGAPLDEHGRPTQFELYTQANSLDVLVPTMSAVSLDYELWSAAGCQRRCDGITISHCPLKEAMIGQACICPVDDLDRADQAKKGKACARILRLNVLLPDLPGMGTWRLETKGFYGTAELLGTLDLLKQSGVEHTIIEAVLRLEQRKVKRPGQGEGKGTLQFVVPVLWPKWTPRQLLAAAPHVLLAPVPAKPLTALIEEVSGDQRTVAAHQTAARAGEEIPALRQHINAVLYAKGLTGGQVEDWWIDIGKKYPDLTPGILTMLYDKLRKAAEEHHDPVTGEVLPDREPGDEDDDRQLHLAADRDLDTHAEGTP